MQQEQRELLRTLYEEYEGGLRLIAYNMKIPECEVDDIVQDTFCKFMDAYGEKALSWDDNTQKAELLTILKNLCHDYFRRLQRKGTVSTDSENDQTEYEIMKYCMAGDVSDNLIANETAVKFWQCVDKMKTEWQDVVTLFMIERRPVKEVSKILEISNAACRMRISRIRKYLREQLED